jgi:polysaccharide biosynthesis protein PslH
MKILIISNVMPYPTDAGEKIRIFNIIKHISQTHEVSLITLIEKQHEEQFSSELKKYCSRVDTVLLRKHSKLEHMPGVMRYLISGEPLHNKFVFVEEMKKKIQQITYSESFDIVQIEHSIMAPYIKAISMANNSKKVLTFHNIASLQYQRIFNTEKNIVKKIRFFINCIQMKKWEANFAMNFDLCVTMSDNEKQFLQSKNPELKVAVIPNGVDVDKFQTLPVNFRTNNLLYIGKMDYQPNVDAVLYFVKKIFPFIKMKIRDAKFFIVGSNPSKKIKQLEKDKDVIVAGYVTDVLPFYEQCAVSVVPLRAGGGTRLKILESMAFGRPIISTSIGCEGLNVYNNENIIISDKPEEFAWKTIELLQNVDFREKISKNGRNLVEHNYSWESIAKKQIQIYDKLTKIKQFHLKK